MDHAGRAKRLGALLKSQKLDALLVTHLPNVRYLCGFTGSSGALLFTRGKPVFFTDGRYIEQARQQVENAKIVISRGPVVTAASAQLGRVKGSLGIEAEHMTVATQESLQSALPAKVRLKPARALVEQLRSTKDPEELSLIRDAVHLGSELFRPGIECIRPGVSETRVAAEMEYVARRRGAEAMSFETIVAAGKRSAMPHGVASNAPVPARGFVILDFGVILHGYCSDMTRTVHVGNVPTRSRQLYEAVLEAQQAAISAIRSGVRCGEVDAAARSVLRKAKLDRYFTHSTGHGVGLEIHEMPRIARNQEEPLRAGMVVTVEPGAYISGMGGVRIEDMVVVTERGCDILTPTTKELIEI